MSVLHRFGAIFLRSAPTAAATSLKQSFLPRSPGAPPRARRRRREARRSPRARALGGRGGPEAPKADLHAAVTEATTAVAADATSAHAADVWSLTCATWKPGLGQKGSETEKYALAAIWCYFAAFSAPNRCRSGPISHRVAAASDDGPLQQQCPRGCSQ